MNKCSPIFIFIVLLFVKYGEKEHFVSCILTMYQSRMNGFLPRYKWVIQLVNKDASCESRFFYGDSCLAGSVLPCGLFEFSKRLPNTPSNDPFNFIVSTFT